MIIVKLSGGLGNQLFQYALGRHIAHIHNAALKFDVSAYEREGSRRYSLDCFNISAGFASKEEVEKLTAYAPGRFERIFGKVLRKCSRLSKRHIIENKSTGFEPRILRLPDGVYLEGYWQSEKYFEGVKEMIRSELTFKQAQSGKNRDMAEQIATSNAISIHVRRGDYVSNPRVSQLHGICDFDYYYQCINKIVQAVEKPHFFIFSDEPEWVSDNLLLEYATTIVDHNGETQDYEDLRLMSQCRNHIIANSSFSWWGAWLNPREDKRVFAPQRWVINTKWVSKDIVPTEWRKL